MRSFCLVFVMVLGCVAGFAREAFAGQFRFQDLEHYYLRFCLPMASDDAAEVRLDSYAIQYASRYFLEGRQHRLRSLH